MSGETPSSVRRAADRGGLARLMARYQAGDMMAFEDLYAVMAPAIRSYFASLGNDRASLDDLVQETFLQVHRARTTYRPAHPLEPWVIGIAHHVYQMHCRRRRRKGDPPRSVDPENVETHAPDPSPEVLAARDALRRELTEVGSLTRAIILLHHLGGWTFREIGIRLGVAETAARLRSSRGLAALRSRLGSSRCSDEPKRHRRGRTGKLD